MPEFKQEEAKREQEKAEELAPYIEAALARKQHSGELDDDAIPDVPAYGRDIIEREGVDEQARGGSFSKT